MSSLLVQKFGGTSVGSPEKIKAVAHQISQAYFQGHSLVVVVSAMGHATDELVNLAYQVSTHPPHREMDMLLTAGERITMALLSMALADQKVPAISLTGSQSGIITDSSHQKARILYILGDRIRAALAQNQVVIVAGFQGVSEAKEVTTLGRGGSDTTAVALASALGANACAIFTDVAGIYSADPRWVPQARFWSEISYESMLTLAQQGAQVLHPRSVVLAQKFQIPITVHQSLHPEAGTRVGIKKPMEEAVIMGVVSDSDKCWVQLEGLTLERWQTLSVQLMDRGLNWSSGIFTGNQAYFFISKAQKEDWEQCLKSLKSGLVLQNYQIAAHRVPVSVVGSGSFEPETVLKELLPLLKAFGISFWYAFGQTVIFLVEEKEAQAVVAAIHQKLFPKESAQPVSDG